MILVKPSFKILSIMHVDNDGLGIDALKLIELAGRTCYRSESKITGESSIKFVEKINDLGHDSVLEHSAITVKFICDRGVSHELVRHRLCSFSQESTRYCNYKGGVTFIIPPWLLDVGEGELSWKDSQEELLSDNSYFWIISMLNCEQSYLNLLDNGWSPQQARSVLPNSLKTEIVVTANFREWRHIFKLRISKAAHPQMRELMIPLLDECKKLIPVIFNNITY